MATTIHESETAAEITPAPRDVPPLENGDHLTRAEFERRFDAMPNLKKAELIEGVVYMPSPISFGRHGIPQFDMIGLLSLYRSATPGVAGAGNSSIRLDLDNMPQPDALLLILPSHGGQTRISADDYVEGAPELVTEVASSSASYDLHAKLNVYRRNGVREYVVWRVREQAIDWFVLREGQFEHLLSSTEGFHKSEVFPGLWLDSAAVVRGDMATAARVVQQGLASPEHAEFIARLQQAAAK